MDATKETEVFLLSSSITKQINGIKVKLESRGHNPIKIQT